jgi:hypothetical protein
VVTFEHDIYSGDHFGTRAKSREIFKRNGYHMVYSDVGNISYAPNDNTLYKFEDWYVFPEKVDMEYVNSITKVDVFNYEELVGFWRLPQK